MQPGKVCAAEFASGRIGRLSIDIIMDSTVLKCRSIYWLRHSSTRFACTSIDGRDRFLCTLQRWCELSLTLGDGRDQAAAPDI